MQCWDEYIKKYWIYCCMTIISFLVMTDNSYAATSKSITSAQFSAGATGGTSVASLWSKTSSGTDKGNYYQAINIPSGVTKTYYVRMRNQKSHSHYYFYNDLLLEGALVTRFYAAAGAPLDESKYYYVTIDGPVSADLRVNMHGSLSNYGDSSGEYRRADVYIYESTIPLNSAPTPPTVNAPIVGTKTNDNTSEITWTFNDPDVGDSQTKYQVQGSRDDFTTIHYDTGIVVSATNSLTTTVLDDGVWKFRIKTYDSSGLESTDWGIVDDITIDVTLPDISVDMQARTVQKSDVEVNTTISDADGIKNWHYKWTNSNVEPTDGWVAGSGLGERVIQSQNGTWYLHLKAEDNTGNASNVSFGPYKKGNLNTPEGWAENTVIEDRKSFKYYIGRSDNNQIKMMLVAPKGNDPGEVVEQSRFKKDRILGNDNKFLHGIYYINKDGQIKEY